VSLIERVVRVVRVIPSENPTLPGTALVITDPSESACAGCGIGQRNRAACPSSHALFSSQAGALTLPNNFNAAPGDRLRIGLETRALGRAALWLTLPPLAGLLGGALLGETAANNLAAGNLGAAIGSGLGLGSGLLLARLALANAGSNLTPIFLHRIPNDPDGPELAQSSQVPRNPEAREDP
jgi:positive regulator of sigma E activity